MSGKRYQSGYDDGFKAGQWAGHGDLLGLVRELRDWLRDWLDGDGSKKDKTCSCPQCTQARELIVRANAALAEAPKAGEQPQGGAGEGRGRRKPMDYGTARRKSLSILDANNYHTVERCCGTCRSCEAGYEDEVFCKLTQVSAEYCAAYIDYQGLCDKWSQEGKEENRENI